MRRRFKAHAAQAAPSATDLASAGHPGEGDVESGTPATIVGPYWFYLVAEQFIRTILASGVQEADLNDDPDQFVSALRNLVSAEVPYADNAEALAGALTDKAINPASLKHVVDNLIASAPGALDTLNELAAALGNDANFHATVTNALALKAPLRSPALTGTPTAPTPNALDRSGKLATTEYVDQPVAFQGLARAANLNWNVGSKPNATIELTGNVNALTLTGAVNGGVYTLVIEQDGTGGRTFAFPAAWKWRRGEVDAISSGAGEVTVLTIRRVGANILAAPLLKDAS